MRRHRNLRHWFGVVATSLVLVASAPRIWAQTAEQEEGQPPQNEATTLFEAGMVAFRDGRPADAQDLFRRSLELQPTPAAAWNLALVLRATNDLVDAVRIARQLDDGRYGELLEEQQTQLETLLEELMRRVALLNITSLHPSEVIASVDGVRVGVVRPGQALEHIAAAGEHVVSGTAQDTQMAEQTVVAPAGAHTDVILTPTSDAEDVPQPAVEEPRRRRWWIAVVVSVIVVGLATGLTVGLLVRDEPQMVTNPPWGVGENGYIEALTAGNVR